MYPHLKLVLVTIVLLLIIIIGFILGLNRACAEVRDAQVTIDATQPLTYENGEAVVATQVDTLFFVRIGDTPYELFARVNGAQGTPTPDMLAITHAVNGSLRAQVGQPLCVVARAALINSACDWQSSNDVCSAPSETVCVLASNWSAPDGPQVLDEGDPGTASTGAWRSDQGVAATRHGAGLICDGPPCTYTWRQYLPLGSFYEVTLWWSQHGNGDACNPATTACRGDAVPVKIRTRDLNGAVTERQLTVNQFTVGTHGKFNVIATAFSYEWLEVEISGQAGRTVSADAIQVRPVPPPQLNRPASVSLEVQ